MLLAVMEGTLLTRGLFEPDEEHPANSASAQSKEPPMAMPRGGRENVWFDFEDMDIGETAQATGCGE